MALGILYNTGQDCTAGSRVYVQDTIYDKFLQILIGKAKELVIGDGFDEKSGGGPVVSPMSCLMMPATTGSICRPRVVDLVTTQGLTCTFVVRRTFAVRFGWTKSAMGPVDHDGYWMVAIHSIWAGAELGSLKPSLDGDFRYYSNVHLSPAPVSPFRRRSQLIRDALMQAVALRREN